MPGIDEGLELAEHLAAANLTAPISVIASAGAEPPVVSRSTTVNVVVRSGSSSSSRLVWNHCGADAMTGR